MSKDKELEVFGNAPILKKCSADKKFAYVVALARAVNALRSAHALGFPALGIDTPQAERDRMSSHLFISGVLYETLRLIRAMGNVFKNDQSFEKSLRFVLTDAAGQSLERMHLKAARHGGVFHFLPDRFAKAIAKTAMKECIFVTGVGETQGNNHYRFADFITLEMLIGGGLDDKIIIDEMMEKTYNLVVLLMDHSETFIADQLNNWGFEVRESERDGG